jgi:hypothetical protein
MAASSNQQSGVPPAACCSPVEDWLAAIRRLCNGNGARCRSKLLRQEAINRQRTLMMARPIAVTLAEAIDQQLANAVSTN